MALTIRQFPCLSDNYGFLLHDAATGATATVDTPDADAINAALAAEGWSLTHIFNTHHHWDHTGGNLALKERWGASVVGPAGEADKIPGLDRALGDGDEVMLGETRARILATPGHTLGHIVYHFAEDACAFVGDTLFALGCGRLFEGTPADMHASLARLAALPDETAIYCAHEYTLSNARFAVTVDPQNPDLLTRMDEIKAARERGEPTVPTRIDAEKATNPFLRADDPAIRGVLGLAGADAVAVFAEIRRRKDSFS